MPWRPREKAGTFAPGLIATLYGRATTMTTNNTWETAKANFNAACARLEQAGEAHADMECEQMAYRHTAPTQEVRYIEKGFKHRSLTMEPHPVKTTLTPAVYGSDHISATLRALPEYAEYGERLKAWQAAGERLSEARGWNAIEREWTNACDAHTEALRQLITAPVNAAEHIAEKIALARADERMDEDELTLLLDAISADLARVS